MSIARYIPFQIQLLTAHFTLSFLLFGHYGRWASKQQTTALFLSTIVTRTRRNKELTNLMRKLCCAGEHSVQLFVQFFYTVKLYSLP